MSDAINPDHYKRLPAEAIEIIEAAIDDAPSAQDAYLHGQVLKYVLRCWHKNGIEDLRKAKWYLDRLIEHCDESLLDANKGLVKAWTCEDGKAKQVYPKPTFKVGDWVRIRKPSDTQTSATSWWPSLDKYDGQIIQVKQIEGDGIVHDEWGFMFEWLEPAEKPAIKQSLNTEPPDGWRWLEVGEVLRRGDTTNTIYEIPEDWIGIQCAVKHNLLRRNRFEVGEKVVYIPDQSVWTYMSEINDGPNNPKSAWVKRDGTSLRACANKLAPYIEETT